MSGLTNTVVVSTRWVDTPLDRPRWRTTANVRVHPRLQVGAEWNPGVDEVVPQATLFVTEPGAPGMVAFLGTSSDRIGSPAGKQAAFLTVAYPLNAVHVMPYASLHYSSWSERVLVPCGAFVALPLGLSLQPMYDGARSHLIVTWSGERSTVSFVWAWLERPGVALSFGF
ncbi:MAG: hypothetical protein ACKOC6_11110 [bacterium]